MSKYWIFQDESGEPGKDEYFLVGILGMTSAVKKRLLDSIQSVRDSHRFYNEMHFHKFSDKRSQVYREVIDEAFKCYLSFRCIVIRREDIDIREHFGNKRHLVYNKFTQLLIYHHIKKRSDDIHIRPDNKNRLKEDNFYDYLIRELNQKSFFEHDYTVKSVKSTDSKLCDASQLCDLLTGVVRNKFVPAGERKNEFSAEILERHSSRINVWEFKPQKKIDKRMF